MIVFMHSQQLRFHQVWRVLPWLLRAVRHSRWKISKWSAGPLLLVMRKPIALTGFMCSTGPADQIRFSHRILDVLYSALPALDRRTTKRATAPGSFLGDLNSLGGPEIVRGRGILARRFVTCYRETISEVAPHPIHLQFRPAWLQWHKPLESAFGKRGL